MFQNAKIHKYDFKILKAVTFVAALFFSCSTPLQAFLENTPEYIEKFHADITIEPDGKLHIVETIVVHAEPKDPSTTIKRGIFRDIPTSYKDASGWRYTVGMDVKKVLHNNMPEPYKITSEGNKTRIRIGSGYVFLTPGFHEYTIDYTTTRQILFFENHDELYWNVTGVEWPFFIKKASAHIVLPTTIPSDKITTNIMTGAWGSREQNARLVRKTDRELVFETTRPLAPFEGLTIDVGFPKDVVPQPSRLQELLWYLWDNFGTFLYLLVLLWYLIAVFFKWRQLRREEKSIAIIPRFYPPEKITPSGARYLIKRFYDTRQLSAELVNMAVKGLITIEYKSGWFGKSTYSLHIAGHIPKQIAPPHEQLLSLLFSDGKTYLELSQSEKSTLAKASDRLKRWLKTSYRDHLCHYQALSLRGHLLALALLICSFFLTGFSAHIGWLIAKIGIAIGIFFAGFALLYRYTKSGQSLVAEVKGFQLFLKTTETERLEMIGTPPTKTPELFEHYLPYAIALDAERQWTKQFASVFARLEQEGHPYVATWFVGRPLTAATLDSLTSDLGKGLSSALSSSLPTSSGGSGSGFSGGGRGGGGGGGW